MYSVCSFWRGPLSVRVHQGMWFWFQILHSNCYLELIPQLWKMWTLLLKKIYVKPVHIWFSQTLVKRPLATWSKQRALILYKIWSRRGIFPNMLAKTESRLSVNKILCSVSVNVIINVSVHTLTTPIFQIKSFSVSWSEVFYTNVYVLYLWLLYLYIDWHWATAERFDFCIIAFSWILFLDTVPIVVCL